MNGIILETERIAMGRPNNAELALGSLIHQGARQFAGSVKGWKLSVSRTCGSLEGQSRQKRAIVSVGNPQGRSKCLWNQV